MAITLKTITGKIVIPGTTTGIRADVTATPMTANRALTFAADDTISWGPVTGRTDGQGLLPASFKIPTSSDQQAQLMWRITVEPVDKRAGLPKSWVMGDYSITGTGTVDLADLVEIDVTVIDTATYVSVQDMVAAAEADRVAAEAARDAAVDISNISTSDGVVSTLVEGTGGAGPLTRAATDTFVADRINTPASDIATALSATFVKPWTPNTTYAAGDKRLVPGGFVGVRKTAGTSGATFDGTSWTVGLQSPGEAVPTLKPTGDGRPGVWEMTHNDTTGYLFHLLCGAAMPHTNAALIGMGIDNDGIGLLVSNKKTGTGISLTNNSTITSATSYGLHGTQISTLGPLVRLEQQAVGGADVLQLIGNAGKTGNLLYAYADGSEVGTIRADTGKIRWQRDIAVWDRASDSAAQYLINSTSGGANSSNTRKTYRGAAQDYFFGATGSAGVYYQYGINHSGSQFQLQVGPNVTSADPLAPLPSETSLTQVVSIRYSGGPQLSFYGVTPVARAAVAAVATDAATTQTLVNDIRAKLVALGLVS